mmetsp:Transcript_20131/g.46181  ORF Transcript_20131/g.46181 Transcript_20131/m.46181 type:complete len:106 (+) Transcript_20131:235-552(+)
MSTVRPLSTRSTTGSNASSVALSSADVNSSSTTIGELRSSTRAKATRCFWPPESCRPCSPTSRSQLCSAKSQPALVAATRTSSSDASGLPILMFSLNDPLRSTGS